MNASRPIPRLLIAGTSSGGGKTTLVDGLIAALRRRGLTVQPFKCGPDYIDAGHHSRAAGRACRNLDTWMLDDEAVLRHFARSCEGADIAVIEGVMGLFDGSDFEDERGSAAQVAKLLGAPVMLVTDISGSARSAAAIVAGFDRFDPKLRLAGCFLNFAGSENHAKGCSRAIASATDVPVLGWLVREEKLRLPERHLGLVQAAENKASAEFLNVLADRLEAQFDLVRICALAREAPELEFDPLPICLSAPRTVETLDAPLLAVARDEAFSFYYPDNLEALEDSGVRVAYFSPTRGECPPPDCDGVYLGGGYPELHAEALARNDRLWAFLRGFHEAGAPLFAECGGFMVLTEGIVGLDGRLSRMGGLLPGCVRMTDKIAGLGYRYAVATGDNLVARAGRVLRGHEFHYSVWEHRAGQADKAAWRMRGVRPGGEERLVGYCDRNLLASYLHIQLAQCDECVSRFVAALRGFRKERLSKS